MTEFLLARRGPLLLILVYFFGFCVFLAEQAAGWADAVDRARGAREELAALMSRTTNTSGAESTVDLGFVATSQTQAVAGFDAFVRNAIGSLGGIVLSSRPEDADPDTGPTAIVISAVFSGQIDIVQSALYKLETGSPPISIDTIEIDAQNDRGPSESPVLNVSMTMSSHWIAAQ